MDLFGLEWFLKIYISQGIAATQLRCGELFNKRLIANCPRNVPVKELGKFVNNWGRYGQRQSGKLFWDITEGAAYMMACWPTFRNAKSYITFETQLGIQENAVHNLAKFDDKMEAIDDQRIEIWWRWRKAKRWIRSVAACITVCLDAVNSTTRRHKTHLPGTILPTITR